MNRRLKCGSCGKDCTDDKRVFVHQWNVDGDTFVLVQCRTCDEELGDKLRTLTAAFNPPVSE